MPVVGSQEERKDSLRSSVVTLDLSGQDLQQIEPLHDGVSAQTILYNHNSISRIENLQYFEHLQQLSLANNRLVEMSGISQAQGLKVLDLSDNSIISIEGLTHLRCLEWLNLSGNSIKRMQNLEKNINLYHLDFSDNSIVKINCLKNLHKLRTLLLHGNLISSLSNISESVPIASIVTLSLGDNEIMDLNEITNLKSLSSLEQLSIAGNPCFLSLSNVIGFNYRPFILVNCPKLRNLDGHLVSQSDRLESEKLRSEGHIKAFSNARHLQLVKYLTQATPRRNTKTPEMDNISINNDRWSVPVLDDKPSTQSDDLKLDVISTSGNPHDFEDDQLVSESCYVPIIGSHSVLSQDTGDIDELLATDRQAHVANANNEVHNDDGLAHDISPERRNGTGREISPVSDNVLSSKDDFDQPFMTEEEAFKLIHLAATVIQARVKGFLTRRKFDFYKYRHRKQAATLIQAVWRGYRTRTCNLKVITVKNEIRTRRLMSHVNYLAGLVISCQDQATRDKRTMAKAIKCLWSELEKQNARYITWLTSQQNQAAIKIQRHWRGYNVRKLYPHPSSLKPTSYPGFFQMCRNMQEEIDSLKTEVELLKLDKLKKEIDETCDQIESAEPHPIPAIRIIRPSVCVLPELKLESSTKEHLKKQANFESVLDDVDIEPLDIGDYDQNNQNFDQNNQDYDQKSHYFDQNVQEFDQPSQDIGNRTFDVEESTFDVDNLCECGNKSCTSQDKEKDQITEKPSECTATVNLASKEPKCAVADLKPREQEIQDILDSNYQSDNSAYSGIKEIATTDTDKMGVTPNDKEETVVMSSGIINMEKSEQESIVQHVEAGNSESDLSKDDQDSDASCATSIQGDISLSSDVSQASDSSASLTKSERKKKKLLLRSTSADQVTRLRSLHASSSLDSERLSSSLNFDSRLSQRAASLLQNLRSEIARVTARHISKEENITAETNEMNSSDGFKQHSTFEANKNKTKTKTYTHQSQSEVLPNTADISRQDTESYTNSKTDIHQSQSKVLPNTTDTLRQDAEPVNRITQTDDGLLEKTNLFPVKVDVTRKGGEIFDKTSVSKIDNQEESLPRVGSQVDLTRKKTEVFPELPNTQLENVQVFLDLGVRSVPPPHCASENRSDDRTDKDTHSFSLPVFHDVGASSLEDIMDDSLEQ